MPVLRRVFDRFERVAVDIRRYHSRNRTLRLDRR
jgi:hypothetical protein